MKLVVSDPDAFVADAAVKAAVTEGIAETAGLNPSQSGLNPSQSVSICLNRCFCASQSVSIRLNPSQSVSIRLNPVSIRLNPSQFVSIAVFVRLNPSQFFSIRLNLSQYTWVSFATPGGMWGCGGCMCAAALSTGGRLPQVQGGLHGPAW
jgi:hypothetical protein